MASDSYVSATVFKSALKHYRFPINPPHPHAGLCNLNHLRNLCLIQFHSPWRTSALLTEAIHLDYLRPFSFNCFKSIAQSAVVLDHTDSSSETLIPVLCLRHTATEVRKEDILKVPELTLLSESEDAGVHLVVARGGREFFVTGHSEYSPLTLDTEYRRDVDKGLPIEIPRNYYVDNDPDKGVMVRWRAHANLLFSNWLNYFVYQETPYNINDIK